MVLFFLLFNVALDTTSSESTARGRRTVDDRITQLVSLGPIQLAKNSSGLQEDKDQQMGSGWNKLI